MKKLTHLTLVILVLGLVILSCERQDSPGIFGVDVLSAVYIPGEPVVLKAGQTIEVGEVQVWNDADVLHIKYVITDPDWCITETHLQVVENIDIDPELDGVPDGIPHKNGNPIPGKFEENDDHDCVSDVLYTYSLEDKGWDAGDDLAIAAHAVVIDLSSAGDPYADEVVEFTRVDGNSYNTSGDNGDDGSDVLGAPAIDPNTPATCTIANGDPNGCWTSPGYVPGQYDGGSWKFVTDAFGQLDNAFCNADPIDPSRCPKAGFITVQFTDNICMFNSDPGEPSLFVWEVGGKTEGFLVEVFNGSVKLDEFTSAPTTQTNGDVPIFFTQTTGTFDIVRLTSTDNGGGDPVAPNTSGPDFDAVECINLVYQDETAWGDGFDFPGKNWATYFTYTPVEYVDSDLTISEGSTPADVTFYAYEGDDLVDGVGNFVWILYPAAPSREVQVKIVWASIFLSSEVKTARLFGYATYDSQGSLDDNDYLFIEAVDGDPDLVKWGWRYNLAEPPTDWSPTYLNNKPITSGDINVYANE